MYKDIVKPTLIVIIISVLVSVLLAFTYNAAGVEKAANAGLSAKELKKYQTQVMPNAKSFEQVQVKLTDKKLLAVYKDTGNAGYALQVVTKGYGGDIKLLVGIGKDGAITGIAATQANETPGLGARAMQPSFLNKFIGVDHTVTVARQGTGDIDAIASSTISSKAVGDGVNEALTLYQKMKGELK